MITLNFCQWNRESIECTKEEKLAAAAANANLLGVEYSDDDSNEDNDNNEEVKEEEEDNKDNDDDKEEEVDNEGNNQDHNDDSYLNGSFSSIKKSGPGVIDQDIKSGILYWGDNQCKKALNKKEKKMCCETN